MIDNQNVSYETFWSKYSMLFILIGFFICIGIALLWLQYEMTNPQGDVQKAISEERTKLDSIKNNCIQLGQYILENKGSFLDPVVREARDMYMVSCK